MRKVAHYFYGCGHELQVYMDRRLCTVCDQYGVYPFNPITGKRTPHPSNGEEQLPTFEELGLYYQYDMPDTGWSGDC